TPVRSPARCAGQTYRTGPNSGRFMRRVASHTTVGFSVSRPPGNCRVEIGGRNGATARLEQLTAEQIPRKYGRRIYSVAWSMLRNDAEGNDVTQEVLLQVVSKLHTFRGRSSVFTWLYRITYCAVLGLRRKRSRCRERQVNKCLHHFGDSYCRARQG